MKYAFKYNSEEPINELINYLENKYHLKYLEVWENLIFSAGLFNINLSYKKKEILFEAPKSFVGIRICRKCKFPVEKNDLKPFIHNPKKGDKLCRNCKESILDYRGKELENKTTTFKAF